MRMISSSIKKRVTFIILCVFVLLLFFTVIVSGREVKKTENIEEIYRYGFSEFLLDKLNLKKYDEELMKNNMCFIPRDKAHKEEAQKIDQMGLQFFYIRNEVHIDRLSEEQKDVLRKQKLNTKLADETLQVIEQSYADVMGYEVIKTEDDKNVKTTYNLTSLPYFVTYETILIKLATMREYDKDGNYIDLQHEKEKEAALEKYVENMEKELRGKLGDTPIAIQLET